MMNNSVREECLNTDFLKTISTSYLDGLCKENKGRFVLSKNSQGEDIYEWIDCHFDELSSWKLWEILGRYREVSSVSGAEVVAHIESTLKMRGDFNDGMPWVRPSQIEACSANSVYQ